MTQIYDSITESKLAPQLRAMGGERCDTFAPHLSPAYLDADGAETTGKPDFLIHRGAGFHFIETKNGSLNRCRTKADSTEALRQSYAEVFGRYGGHLAHHELSSALYAHSERGRIAARAGGWNHSVYKLLAMQAQHGWQRFLVVFQSNPSGRDAELYCRLGLVFCTIKTLPDFLQTIELMRHGIFIPFVHKSKNYTFTVTPDLSTDSLDAADVEAIDRTRFLEAVATEQAGPPDDGTDPFAQPF